MAFGRKSDKPVLIPQAVPGTISYEQFTTELVADLFREIDMPLRVDDKGDLIVTPSGVGEVIIEALTAKPYLHFYTYAPISSDYSLHSAYDFADRVNDGTLSIRVAVTDLTTEEQREAGESRRYFWFDQHLCIEGGLTPEKVRAVPQRMIQDIAQAMNAFDGLEYIAAEAQ